MSSELTAVMDRYLAALVAHDPRGLNTRDATVTENGYPIELGHGLFETASEITYRHYVEDHATGQIALFGVVRESLLLANVHVRLKVERGAIREIETIIARQGGSSIARPEKLSEPKPIYAEQLAAAERAPRAALIAVANRYELFKVVSGQIREIEALMVNVPLGATCGWRT